MNNDSVRRQADWVAVMAAIEGEKMKNEPTEAEKLLKEALDIFSGEMGLCYEPDTPEWYWRWKVRYYFGDTDIPVHEIPKDMRS